jgi:hypothetical protein
MRKVTSSTKPKPKPTKARAAAKPKATKARAAAKPKATKARAAAKPKATKPKATKAAASRAAARPSRADRRAGAGRSLLAKPAKPKAGARPGGSRVNPIIKTPTPPGPWVDEERNLISGQRYKDFRSQCDFREAARRIRAAADQQGIPGGGFRSRGPMLHAMRTCKLEQWYERAMNDEGLWNHEQRRPYTPRELAQMSKAAQAGAKRSRPARDEWDNDPF